MILIAGGGLGGLCAALGLLRAGRSVRVFEQAPVLGEVGAGLTVTSGALRCFELLGLEQGIARLISRPRTAPFVHYRTAELLSGALPADGDAETPPERFAPGHLYRADLHALLVESVRALDPDALVTGQRAVGVAQSADGVELQLAEGGAVGGEALIACDGVRSGVRAALLGDGDPRFTGRVAYRFLVPGDVARQHLGAVGPAGAFVGPGKVFNRYLISGGRWLNCVGLVRSDRWTEEGWSTPATRDELRAEFAGWHPDVLALVEAAPADRTLKWGLFDREPLDRWVHGRVALLGDAAHPMLPFLGLGATMAIEDAAILSRAFAESATPEEALVRYERARVPRASRAQLGSREQAAVFDRTDPSAFPPPGAPSHDPSFQQYDPRTVEL